MRSKISLNDINKFLNLKANNSEVFQAIDNICNSIETLPNMSLINEINKDKISKNEIENYLKEKPSIEDIQNLLDDKIGKNEFNNKFEDLVQNIETFKKFMGEKIDELASKKELKKIENNQKDMLNNLEKKADKEYVFNSLKIKSDKNEILKLIENKLNKDEFINYQKIKDNEIRQNNNKLDDTYLTIIKEMNNKIQEIKKNINTRFDILNIDIEKINDKIKSKYESINILINEINSRKLDNVDYINLLKKKLDIDKFDPLIKKIKNNLERNFVEISKTNEEMIKNLMNNKINDINKVLSKTLDEQNTKLNNYIEINQNKWIQYQIDVQSIINKLDSENKSEISKLRNEIIENLEVKITEKFYELTEETKVNKNNNQNSLLNSNDNELNNKLSKNMKTESLIREKCEINELTLKYDEIKNELKNNRIEFSNALDNQALINETLCEENKLGKWGWTMGKLKNNYNIIWDIQSINTYPDNYILENDKSILLIKQGGIYEIIFGFYGYNKKPNIQILVNNEIILSNSNKNNKSLYENGGHSLHMTNTGFYKSNKNIAINGGFRNITGITLIDYIYLENNSKLSVFYNGDTARGFLSIKKIMNFK